jgi:hypothetical protein
MGRGLAEWIINAPDGQKLMLQLAYFSRNHSPVTIAGVDPQCMRAGLSASMVLGQGPVTNAWGRPTWAAQEPPAAQFADLAVTNGLRGSGVALCHLKPPASLIGREGQTVRAAAAAHGVRR